VASENASLLSRRPTVRTVLLQYCVYGIATVLCPFARTFSSFMTFAGPLELTGLCITVREGIKVYSFVRSHQFCHVKRRAQGGKVSNRSLQDANRCFGRWLAGSIYCVLQS
jgi:hypothetical protein